MPMDPEWHEWRGGIDSRMHTNNNQMEQIESRLNRLEEKVGDVVAKMAVPLFAIQIFGTVVGAVIVYYITRGAK